MNQLWIDCLDESRFVPTRVTAVLAEHRKSHIRSVAPPVDHQSAHVLLLTNLGGELIQHGGLWTAMPVNHYDVAKAVLRKPQQHISHIGAVGRLRNRKRSGISVHASGDAIRNNGGDHGVDFTRDFSRYADGRGNVGAAVDD